MEIIYIKGIAEELHVYSHTDTRYLNDKTQLQLQKAELLIYPVVPLIRKIESEDFPTWQV